jgi:hypothetical protein
MITGTGGLALLRYASTVTLTAEKVEDDEDTEEKETSYCTYDGADDGRSGCSP